MKWENNFDKRYVLHYYQKMGFSCSLIKGSGDEMNKYKDPFLKVSPNIDEQDLEEYTGLGIHLGQSEVRAIDIDDFHIQVSDNSDPDSQKLYRLAESYFIKKCMNLLGLPEDYEWLIRTPHGWHIIISAPSFGFEKTAYCAKNDLKPNVVSGSVIRLSRIELLWSGFMVMPPSKSKYVPTSAEIQSASSDKISHSRVR